MKTNPNIKSLYIHVPYCKRICNYCDFCKKSYDFSESLLFVLDLVKDLKQIMKKYETIYIGGGTPTCLDEKLLELLLKSCSNLLAENYEFTIEANPENLTEDKLKLLKKYGVNRLSIGVQTFNKNILEKLNREVIDIEKIIENAHKYVKNLNIDLIYGMSFSSFDNVKNDLNIALSLPISHISLYSLSINPHTVFYVQKVKEMDPDELANQYEYIRNYLRENGFEHYEVSNFAKPGFRSKHNLVYWKNEAYDALGPGAAGYDYKYRYKYTYNILDYIYNKTLIENEEVDVTSDFEYEIILALRTSDGLNIEKINQKFNINFLEKYQDNIHKLIDLNMIYCDEKSLKCRDNGIFLEEEIVRKLLF